LLCQANVVIQVSVYSRKESDAWAIAGRVKTVLLDDNETLNTAGVKNMIMVGSSSLREANLSHIPLRFSFSYLLMRRSNSSRRYVRRSRRIWNIDGCRNFKIIIQMR
jgi:hypothetical protein